MPTISGLRRLGYTPESIRRFCERIGVAKRDSTVDLDLLKWSLREELNRTADRVMAVLRPLKVVITNYPEGQVEDIECVNNPEDESAGTRMVPFSPGDLDRARRLPRGGAAQVLPPEARHTKCA